MPDIITSFQTLRDTPVPNILLVAGIIFLFLSFVGKFAFGIDITNSLRQRVVLGFLGGGFIFLGIALYSGTPVNLPTSSAVTPPTPTHTLTSEPTNTSTPTATLQPPTSTSTPAPTDTPTVIPTTPTPHPTYSNFDARIVIDPVVIFDDGLYKMWYTGQDTKREPGLVFRVGYATSSDGINWTKYEGNPVLDLEPGIWEADTLRVNTVIKNGNTYQMWYSGGIYNGIGYATSMDGIHWIKYSGNPVLSAGISGSWDGGMVTFAHVILDKGQFKMWYSGSATNDFSTPFKIGYATSTDGINWTRTSANPVLDVGLDWERGSILDSYVIWDGTSYKMWYTGFDKTNTCDANIQTGYATSTDGITWTKSAQNPILPIDSTSWDSKSATGSSVIFNGSTYQMWYHGGIPCTGIEEIGYATSNDGISWMKYTGNPVLKAGQ